MDDLALIDLMAAEDEYERYLHQQEALALLEAIDSMETGTDSPPLNPWDPSPFDPSSRGEGFPISPLGGTGPGAVYEDSSSSSSGRADPPDTKADALARQDSSEWVDEEGVDHISFTSDGEAYDTTWNGDQLTSIVDCGRAVIDIHPNGTSAQDDSPASASGQSSGSGGAAPETGNTSETLPTGSKNVGSSTGEGRTTRGEARPAGRATTSGGKNPADGARKEVAPSEDEPTLRAGPDPVTEIVDRLDAYYALHTTTLWDRFLFEDVPFMGIGSLRILHETENALIDKFTSPITGQNGRNRFLRNTRDLAEITAGMGLGPEVEVDGLLSEIPDGEWVGGTLGEQLPREGSAPQASASDESPPSMSDPPHEDIKGSSSENPHETSERDRGDNAESSRTADVNNENPGSAVGAMRRPVYEESAKHGGTSYSSAKGKVSPAPTNGQAALDNSVVISNNSPRRIGIDPETDEIVILDLTRERLEDWGPAKYHGHVETWDELDDVQKNALIRAGLVDRRGRILE